MKKYTYAELLTAAGLGTIIGFIVCLMMFVPGRKISEMATAGKERCEYNIPRHQSCKLHGVIYTIDKG